MRSPAKLLFCSLRAPNVLVVVRMSGGKGSPFKCVATVTEDKQSLELRPAASVTLKLITQRV